MSPISIFMFRCGFFKRIDDGGFTQAGLDHLALNP